MRYVAFPQMMTQKLIDLGFESFQTYDELCNCRIYHISSYFLLIAFEYMIMNLIL